MVHFKSVNLKHEKSYNSTVKVVHPYSRKETHEQLF